MQFTYPAKIEKDEDGRFLVTFRDIPEAITDGADEGEALSEAFDVLDSALSFRVKYNEEIPEPSKARAGEVMVAASLSTAAKAALHRAMKESGMNTADLARALKVDHKEARRILDPQHETKFQRVAQAFLATGHDVDIKVKKTPRGREARTTVAA
jgi:antitoxin HicB